MFAQRRHIIGSLRYAETIRRNMAASHFQSLVVLSNVCVADLRAVEKVEEKWSPCSADMLVFTVINFTDFGILMTVGIGRGTVELGYQAHALNGITVKRCALHNKVRQISGVEG